MNVIQAEMCKPCLRTPVNYVSGLYILTEWERGLGEPVLEALLKDEVVQPSATETKNTPPGSEIRRIEQSRLPNTLVSPFPRPLPTSQHSPSFPHPTAPHAKVSPRRLTTALHTKHLPPRSRLRCVRKIRYAVPPLCAICERITSTPSPHCAPCERFTATPLDCATCESFALRFPLSPQFLRSGRGG